MLQLHFTAANLARLAADTPDALQLQLDSGTWDCGCGGQHRCEGDLGVGPDAGSDGAEPVSSDQQETRLTVGLRDVHDQVERVAVEIVKVARMTASLVERTRREVSSF